MTQPLRLYLVRHGKAERDAPSGRDEDRPLAERGERQAVWLGRAIAQLPRADRPTVIHASPAARASATAQILQRQLQVDLRFEEALRLGAALDASIGVVRDIIGRAEQAMIVGHNPTLEVMLELLTGDDDCAMRTGEAAVLHSAAPDVGTGAWRLMTRMRMDD
ncbi:MAG: histidine phosphatase family protein [Phycisphaerae bacterium]|nr:histidine phosphatase family protein [Phycisphaerae bacterium]